MPTQVPLWMRIEADSAQFDGEGIYLTQEERGELFVLEYARLFREWDEYSGLLQSAQVGTTTNRTTVLDSIGSNVLFGLGEDERATPEAKERIDTVVSEAGAAAVSSIFYDKVAEDLEGGLGRQLKERFQVLLGTIIGKDVAVTAVREPSTINRVYRSGVLPSKKVEKTRGSVDIRTILQPEAANTRAECEIEGAGEMWLLKALSYKDFLVYPLIDNDYNATVDLSIK